jgi:opacity protein-like surface antigen
VKLLVEGAPDGSYSVDGGIDFIVRPNLRIGAEVGYLNFGSMVIGGGTHETSLSAIPVLGQITYDATSWEGIVPYLRGGAGLYHLRANDDGPDDDDTFTENNFGLNIGGGVRIEGENTFSYAVEFRYHLALREIEDWDIIEIFGRVIF